MVAPIASGTVTDPSPRAHRSLKANDPCWCGSGKKFKRCHKVSSTNIAPGHQSPMRSVPPEIGRPPYAESGQPVRRPENPVQSDEVIKRMRVAGRAAAEVLAETGAAVAPGITTDALDAYCHQACIDRGGYPSPLNYNGFPKSLCTSVNEVICHGIPDDRALLDGDIVNLDVTRRRLDVELDEAELARRRAAWRAPEPRYTIGVFAKYARLVSGAEQGAVTG